MQRKFAKTHSLLLAAAFAAAQLFGARYFMQGDMKGSDTPYGDNKSASTLVPADDIEIYCETYGEGAPLVVFHGGGVGSPYEMGALIDALRGLGKFRVTVVSTRGHGRTPAGKHRMSIERRALDAAAVVRAVADGKKAVLLGFSDGAYTSLALAGTHPELVEKVVAIGAGTVKPGAFPPDASISELLKADPAFADYSKKIMPEYGHWQEYITDYMSWWSKAEVGREFFSRIKCPVLYIVGDDDDHAPVRTVVEARELTPGSRLAVIPKAWHTCFLDNFESVWSAVKPFLGNR